MRLIGIAALLIATHSPDPLADQPPSAEPVLSQQTLSNLDAIMAKVDTWPEMCAVGQKCEADITCPVDKDGSKHGFLAVIVRRPNISVGSTLETVAFAINVSKPASLIVNETFPDRKDRRIPLTQDLADLFQSEITAVRPCVETATPKPAPHPPRTAI